MTKIVFVRFKRDNYQAQSSGYNAYARPRSVHVAVAPQALSDKEYAYYTDIDGIAVGDTLVVDSPYNGLVTVVCSSLGETVEGIERAAKWIVCKVDLEAHEAREKARKAREVLMAKITKARKEALAKLELTQLAAVSPELAGLLDQLNTLDGAVTAPAA